jgi:hypothetical protein
MMRRLTNPFQHNNPMMSLYSNIILLRILDSVIEGWRQHPWQLSVRRFGEPLHQPGEPCSVEGPFGSSPGMGQRWVWHFV